ncbi:MAG: dihydrolipoamide acetyltransferase family protein [Candidatus Promineifilaceae bacterium]
MAEYVVMPKLGFDMREGVLNQWVKSIGEPVTRGEVIAEIESDKATLELESQVEGTLLHVLQEPGAIVPVGANLAIVGEEGEDISDMLSGGTVGEAPETVAEAGSEPAVESSQAKTAPPTNGAGQPATAVSAEFPDGVKATPVARRIAKEKGIDLTLVAGGGPDGRIRKADVEAYLASPRPAAVQTTTAPREYTVSEGEDVEVIETSKLRQAIGRRMTESKTTVPHFYVTSEVDMDKAMALRKEINEALPDESKVTVNDLIVKAAALALKDYPNLNASFAGEKLVRHKSINIGTAVAVEGGLLTIVQKNTDSSSLATIAVDNKSMISRAREGKVKPDDVEGSTFTVSNLGAFDVDHFIAIINPPDAAILAVGSAKKVPVVKDGELAVGIRMKMTISADHRVTDGVEAAKFLQAVKALLEKPVLLLL